MKKAFLLFLISLLTFATCVGCGNAKTMDEDYDVEVENEENDDDEDVYVDEEDGETDEFEKDDSGTQSDGENVAAVTNNAEINFFIDSYISNNDRLLDICFMEADENGNPTLLYTKGGAHSEITLCNYQILSGSIENCSMEDSIIIYADCLYADNDSDQLSINLYPTGEGNIWEMMITSPADLEGFYSLEGPVVEASDVSVAESANASNYWFVNYQFVRDDENATFKLIGEAGGDPTKVEVTIGDPYNENEIYDIESFSVQQRGSFFDVSLTYQFYNSEGDLALSEIDFECQDGEAEVSAPGNMYGHYSGF